MAKLSLVAGVGVSALPSARGSRYSTTLWKLSVLLLFFAAARPVHAQTVLSVNTHWADATKCSCTITIKQMNANGSTTTVFQGVTDDTGHLSGSANLLIQGVYSLSITSNAYGIPLLSLPFSTGLVAALPLKSATLNFVFTRPAVNGAPVQCCSLPATYTPPSLAAGTSVQFGL